MDRSSYTSNRPYVPNGISELWDFLGTMMLSAPKFKDTTGYFPDRNLETEFFALNEGLKTVRKKVGEENYQTLIALSDKMRAHFEADANNETDDTLRGRECIIEMEHILKASSRRKSR